MNYRLLILMVGIAVIAIQPTFAKKREVKGKVTTFNKIPLQKVSIVSKNFSKEILTDENGHFNFTCDDKDKISFEAKGFFSEKVKMQDFEEQDSIMVDLRFKKGKKNFEYATGYGHISERQLSYAIDHLEAGPDYSSYRNILQAIEGKMPGVTVGVDGINIRGTSTLSGPTPALLVVDGTIVQYSVFANIPPTQVKSIDVIKGAAASARYGSRGMGGVVIVTTKSEN